MPRTPIDRGIRARSGLTVKRYSVTRVAMSAPPISRIGTARMAKMARVMRRLCKQPEGSLGARGKYMQYPGSCLAAAFPKAAAFAQEYGHRLPKGGRAIL